jgi:hypothetical protein
VVVIYNLERWYKQQTNEDNVAAEINGGAASWWERGRREKMKIK